MKSRLLIHFSSNSNVLNIQICTEDSHIIHELQTNKNCIGIVRIVLAKSLECAREKPSFYFEYEFYGHVCIGWFQHTYSHPHLLVRPPVNGSYQHWLHLVALIGYANFKSGLCQQNRSLVARTSKCGWAISLFQSRLLLGSQCLDCIRIFFNIIEKNKNKILLLVR